MLLRLALLLLGAARVYLALRVKDNIRISLTNVENNCMRLLNGTHQVGCQSSREGNTGVVTLITTANDLQSSDDHLPWGLESRIALVNVKNLDKRLLQALRTTKNIVGVLLYKKAHEQLRGWSEDAVCPNQAFSFYPTKFKCEWNKDAALANEGFQYLEIDKPVFILTNMTEINILLNDCYRAHNQPNDRINYRCVAKMQSFMFGAGDSRLCQERGTHTSLTDATVALCDELYDYNVISLLPAIDANVPRAEVLMLATRMDSFSIFSQSRGGDESVLGSLITTLAVARSVGAHREAIERAANSKHRQVAFTFFAAEALGNIGSSATVFEMQQPSEPIVYKPERTAKHLRLDDLAAFIEIQQIGANHSTMFLHSDHKLAGQFSKQMTNLRAAAQRGAKRSGGNATALYNLPNARVPPASYQTFLRALHIPGFVIAPFESQYTTHVLNSFLDTQLSDAAQTTRDSIRAAVLRDIVLAGNMALQIVGEHVGDQTLADSLRLDIQFASELVDCFILDFNWNCSLFRDLFANQTFDPSLHAHRTYGTHRSGFETVRRLVGALLTYALGDANSATNVQTQSECWAKNKEQSLYVYLWQHEPNTDVYHCYRTSTYVKLARSPAFEIEGYDLSNGTYPSWMESRWEKIELEIFLAAGYTFELYAATIAIVMLVLSVVLCRFIDESWFIDQTDVLPTEV